MSFHVNMSQAFVRNHGLQNFICSPKTKNFTVIRNKIPPYYASQGYQNRRINKHIIITTRGVRTMKPVVPIVVSPLLQVCWFHTFFDTSLLLDKRLQATADGALSVIISDFKTTRIQTQPK